MKFLQILQRVKFGRKRLRPIAIKCPKSRGNETTAMFCILTVSSKAGNLIYVHGYYFLNYYVSALHRTLGRVLLGLRHGEEEFTHD